MRIINKQSISSLNDIDPIFGDIVDRYGKPPSWSRPQGFDTLSRIILEQQVSLASGKATYEKLSSLVSNFTPSEIIKLSPAEMRKATVSRQKSGYIIGLAHSILNRTLDLSSLTKKDPAEVTEILTSIKGIGPWTAEVYLLFALQSPDIYPRGDIALINTIKELWQVKDGQDALLKSKQWSPFRSAASYLLWHYYLSKRGRTSPI